MRKVKNLIRKKTEDCEEQMLLKSDILGKFVIFVAFRQKNQDEYIDLNFQFIFLGRRLVADIIQYCINYNQFRTLTR